MFTVWAKYSNGRVREITSDNLQSAYEIMIKKQQEGAVATGIDEKYYWSVWTGLLIIEAE